MKKSPARKGVAFSANPILSVRLPMWRSKLVVFLLFMAFVALAARAFWMQGPGNAFYQKQGEIRYQRTLELPATRGKIIDRNGQVLATSLPVQGDLGDSRSRAGRSRRGQADASSAKLLEHDRQGTAQEARRRTRPSST